jgi:peroxiredoxin
VQTSSNTGAVTNGEPAPITGAPAPDFILTNTQSKSITLSDLKGQPILINFWATWCGPCRIEMPAIEAAYQKYKGAGLRVLAVDSDEPLQQVTDFGASLNLTFDLLLDPGNSVNDLYRIRAYPSSFFVGADGTVVALQIGTMSEAQLFENLAKILPQ